MHPTARVIVRAAGDASREAGIGRSKAEQMPVMLFGAGASYGSELQRESHLPGGISTGGSDIAMMNDAVMLGGIRPAFPAGLPQGVDQVWFADTSIEGALEFREFTPQLRAR